TIAVAGGIKSKSDALDADFCGAGLGLLAGVRGLRCACTVREPIKQLNNSKEVRSDFFMATSPMSDEAPRQTNLMAVLVGLHSNECEEMLRCRNVGPVAARLLYYTPQKSNKPA